MEPDCAASIREGLDQLAIPGRNVELSSHGMVLKQQVHSVLTAACPFVMQKVPRRPYITPPTFDLSRQKNWFLKGAGFLGNKLKVNILRSFWHAWTQHRNDNFKWTASKRTRSLMREYNWYAFMADDANKILKPLVAQDKANMLTARAEKLANGSQAGITQETWVHSKWFRKPKMRTPAMVRNAHGILAQTAQQSAANKAEYYANLTNAIQISSEEQVNIDRKGSCSGGEHVGSLAEGRLGDCWCAGYPP